MSSLIEPPSSPCKANSATSLKMTGISNDQPPKVGLTANGQISTSNGQISTANGQISITNVQIPMGNGQSPTKQASNSQNGSDDHEAKNGHKKKKSNGGRSNGRDESEARYSEFTRKSILSDPRYRNGVKSITQKCFQ